MTPEQIALARRLVTCPHFHWMPGIKAWKNGYGSWLSIDSNGSLYLPSGPAAWKIECLPDLTDPATLGCLLSLVRKAYNDEVTCLVSIDYGPGGVRWVCRLTLDGRNCTEMHWTTEAEALVATLEAAHDSLAR